MKEFRLNIALRKWSCFLAGIFLSFSIFAQDRPNILFIAVDDLNCDFGAYGNTVVKSPTLDQIAAEGILFTNNHCQKAVCGASRASLLSGFTPEHTGITGFRMYLRDMYPDVVTLPQFFKNNGYTTVGMGKIHDPRNVSLTDEVDLVSWTRWIDVSGNRYAASTGNPVTEAGDVEDNAYIDGNLADSGVVQIRALAAGNQPFFLAVGFKKPHLPFAAPRKYWDMYDRDSISLAAYRKFAVNDVEFIHNPGSEFRNGYDDVPLEGDFPIDLQRKYIHGYYACVSFIDKQIGKLINELKAQGAYENTIIVIWGDHGFSLGDHTNWGKHTNFEHATRCPLIVRAPGGRSGFVCSSPSELLDLYPTLADLAGFEVPDTLDGNSLKPILDGVSDKVKSFAISQFTRGGSQGFALRSDYYQYVEWDDDGLITHKQLFNFAADPYQTRNLFLDPDYSEIIDTFSFRLNRYLNQGENTAPINLTSDTDSLGTYRVYHQLGFSVFGKNGSSVGPVKDAEIQIGPLELPTSAAGYAALRLPPAEYYYRITFENFDTLQGRIDLAQDTFIRDTLNRLSYQISIKLTDVYSNLPIPGIELEINGNSVTTGFNGEALFNLAPGSYQLSINEAGYKPFGINIEVVEDAIFPLQLVPDKADLKFRLKEDGVPVNEAVVFVSDTLTAISNSIGIASFTNLPADTEFQYLISKEGYVSLEGSVFLQTDTTVELEMEQATYDITFLVSDQQDESPLAGVLVSLGTSTGITGEDGVIFFENMLEGNYSYVLESEGYESVEGSLALTSDTIVEVDMMITSFAEIFSAGMIQVFPNPAHNLLSISSPENVRVAQLVNVYGTIIDQFNLDGDRKIYLEDYQPGMYFINLKDEHGEEIYVRKFIKK